MITDGEDLDSPPGVSPSRPRRSYPRLSASWRFLVAGVAVLGLRLVIALPGWYAGDDASFKLEAWTTGFWASIAKPHFGNLMPASLAIEWFRVRLAPIYDSAAVILLLTFAVSCVLMWVLLTVLQVSRRARIVGTAFFLVTPLTAEVTWWWATGLNNTLFLPFALVAVIAGLRYVRDGGPRWLVVCAAGQVIALGFFQKAVLVPIWIACIALVTPWVSKRLVHCLAVTIGVSVAYALVYVNVVNQEGLRASGLPGVDQVIQVTLSFFAKSVGVALAGGPWLFVSAGGPSEISTPWWLLVPVLVLVVGMFVALPRSRRWRVAAMIGVWLLADTVLLFYGRSGEGMERVLGATDWTRYVADLAVPLSVAMALLVERLSRRVVLVGAAVFAASTCVAWAGAAKVWQANPGRQWTEQARMSVGEREGPLLSQSVPEMVNPPPWGPAAAAEGYLAALVPDDAWTPAAPAPGGLTVEGVLGETFAARDVASTQACGRQFVMALTREVPDGTWILRVDVRSDTSQPVGFRLDSWVSGTSVAEAPAGSTTQYISLRGTGPRLLVTAPEDVCVDRAEIGRITQ